MAQMMQKKKKGAEKIGAEPKKEEKVEAEETSLGAFRKRVKKLKFDGPKKKLVEAICNLENDSGDDMERFLEAASDLLEPRSDDEDDEDDKE